MRCNTLGRYLELSNRQQSLSIASPFSTRHSFDSSLLPGFLAYCNQPLSTALRQLAWGLLLGVFHYRRFATDWSSHHVKLPPSFSPLRHPKKASYTGAQLPCLLPAGHGFLLCSGVCLLYPCGLCFCSKLIDSGLTPPSGTNSQITTSLCHTSRSLTTSHD